MNKIIYKYNDTTTLTFTDQNDSTESGKIIEGSFYNETSLLEDELSIDTMTVQIRYEKATPSLISFGYGAEVDYYKDDALYAIYYLKDITRDSKYEYTLSLQSSIGLLDDTNHYGGIYTGETASEVMNEIIGGKITYTEDDIFQKIKIYGWLPIATRRENLKQVLFAAGGCVKKKNGNVFFSTLAAATPNIISSNRVFDSGKITYDAPASRIEVVEHQYSKVANAEVEEIYAGEIVGSSFTSPRGQKIDNGAIITWDEPHHSITFEGTTLLNDEVGVNYAVVSAAASATIKGKPYVHSKLIVSRDKENYNGKEKVAKVEEATLISLANSNSVADKIMAYYEAPNTLTGSIVLDAEKPLDTITIPNQFEETSTGIIKSIEGTFGQQITRGEIEMRLNYDPPVIEGTRILTSIAVITQPNRTVYEAGERFDKTGMVVQATYEDGATAIVKNYTYSPITLGKNTTQVVITYREGGIGKSTELPITVSNIVKNIVITTPPDDTEYAVGDTFNAAGMEVKAYYSDGSSKFITNYTCSPTTISSANDNEITISYTEDNITKTAIQAIAVGNVPDLQGISIITNPTKMTYMVGEFFNIDGMIVVANFSDGTSKQIRGYSYEPTELLTGNDTTIIISYTQKEITKTTTLNINIISLESIAITKEPTYKTYYDTESFNTTGMEVTAYYSDGSSKVVDGYTYSPEGILPYGTTEVVISFTEHGITKTTTQAITVSVKKYDFTNSIVISEAGDYTLEGIGATHRNIRVVCIGGGSGGQAGANGSDGTSSNGGTASSDGTRKFTSNGSGGSGGKGGKGGTAGKVMQQEYVLPNLTSTFTISIGTGGEGGASKAASGTEGINTTFTHNSNIIDSANGSASTTGYTNTFTNETYAIAGTDGEAGGAGGRGAYASSWNQSYSDIGYYYSVAGESVIYNDVTYSGGARNKTKAGDGTSLQGSTTGNPAYCNRGLGGGGGGAAVGNNGSAGGSGYTKATQDNFAVRVYCGGGGDGASAIEPEAPTVYGCGGNGGHGGGGGGGGGGGAVSKIDGQYWTGTYGIADKTFTLYGRYGGDGGSGSAGSAGVQGCVIIYYS